MEEIHEPSLYIVFEKEGDVAHTTLEPDADHSIWKDLGYRVEPCRPGGLMIDSDLMVVPWPIGDDESETA